MRKPDPSVIEVRRGHDLIRSRSRIPAYYPHALMFEDPHSLFLDSGNFPRLKHRAEQWCIDNDLEEGYDFHTGSAMYGNDSVGIIAFKDEVAACAFKMRWFGRAD